MIHCTGKVPPQILGEELRMWWLHKPFVVLLADIDAHGPTLLSNIDAYKHILTGERDLGKFLLHGKPPFGCGTLLVDTAKYALKSRLTF